jgi:RNA polymerase sigma-70 factor (ECF subfamily)
LSLFRRRKDAQERFEALVLPHLDALYGAAVRMTRHRQDAEDLVQETCLRAYRFLDRLDDEGRCRAWLFRILTNTFINLYRKAQRTPETVELEACGVDAAASGEEVSLEAVLDDDLKAALDALPDEYRVAVLMSDVEDFTYDEIAGILGCPVGTVRSRIHRGRNLLRTHLLRAAGRRGGQQGGGYA